MSTSRTPKCIHRVKRSICHEGANYFHLNSGTKYVKNSGMSHHFLRGERALIYPPYTVLQFAIGLAVPAQVPNRTVLTNWGIVSNIPLPSQTYQLYPHVRRTARHRLLTHDHVFKFFEKALLFSGNAEQCILKTICQVSQTKMEEDNLLTKLLRILFSVSHTKYAVSEKHYFIAEQNGQRKNISCSQTYPYCNTSILDFMSHVD